VPCRHTKIIALLHQPSLPTENPPKQRVHVLATTRDPRDPPIDSTAQHSTASTMPTPDETAFPPSPPIDIPARSSFPSCPPEEEREDPRDESDDDNSENDEEDAAAPPADHAIAQEPTPEPDALEGASTDNHNAQSQSKDRIVEDPTAAQAAHTPRPTTVSHDAVVALSESEMQAQRHAASSNPHASMSSFPPQYMDVTPDKDRVSAVRSCHSWDAC